ncbi:MAG: selenocysteine-specific translation elongation factor, partial [Chthoniobacterales bacterium]|nr:selenocysteine-specific translation elongation factor [Chthoniobacterales bacterium]
GKTALIKALTGTDTDRLPEEKVRGITIDLGFAHLSLPGVSLGIIDVPGHEDFVRNMIAGLGAIDLALLVVAADDGWMPQTEEHWQILNYLGVRQIVVALTKCDLGDPGQIEANVRDRLGAVNAPIVRTSVRSQRGFDDLKQTLADVCARLSGAPDIRKPRLFVDRVFTVRGAGTVVTGTLAGGQLARGKNVTLQPQNLRAHIRAIQSHNQLLEFVLPGTRTALNLPELRLEDIPRGSVLTNVEGVQSSRTIDVMLERSDREILASRPLKNASVIRVHYGSARFTARITLLDRRELLPGDKAIARLRCTKPAFVFVGDRFIIRDSSGRATIAGGIVLNPDAEGTKFRSATERVFLQSRASAPNDVGNLVCSQVVRDGICQRESLLLKSNFSAAAITASIARLVRDRAVFVHAALVADSSWWQALRDRAIAAIDAEHSAHPERAGLDLAALRAALSLDRPEVFQALIADLCAEEFSSANGAIWRQSHRPSLPPHLQEAARKIRAALAAKPFNPPSRKELTPDLDSERALRFLIETREVVEVTKDVVLGADAFAKMRDEVVKFIDQNGPAAAGQLREALGSSRRIMMPFLERLDREGVTRRSGDKRTLNDPDDG